MSEKKIDGYYSGGVLVHSSQGKTWTKHKYIEKYTLPNGKTRYVYKKNGANLTSDSKETLQRMAIEDELLEKYYNSNMPISEFQKMVDAQMQKENGANGMPSSAASNKFEKAKDDYRNPWKFWLKDK